MILALCSNKFFLLALSAETVVSLNECPGYDTKQFDGETPILEIWGSWSKPLLLLGLL